MKNVDSFCSALKLTTSFDLEAKLAATWLSLVPCGPQANIYSAALRSETKS